MSGDTLYAKCRKCGAKVRAVFTYCASCAARLVANGNLREHERATILAEAEDQ